MSTSPIPKVRDDDPEDVSWALSTAATSFARGDRVEALKWLRRAAEAASEADHDSRALEIAKAAAELSPPSVPPSRPAVSPSVTPKAPPASIPPRPATASVKPPPKPAAKPAPKAPPPAAGKPARRPSKPDDTSKRPALKSRPRSAPPPDERTDSHIVTEVTRMDAKAPHHHDPESWPTEAMDGEQLDALGQSQEAGGPWGQERTRIGAPAYDPQKSAPKPDGPQFRASQAVAVVIWRDADGKLRVAPRGTAVSAVTIEALLVAPAPDVDLLAWLGPS